MLRKGLDHQIGKNAPGYTKNRINLTLSALFYLVEVKRHVGK